MRFREGSCPEFGRVRPVHLDELVSMEHRLEVRDYDVVSMMRLGWAPKRLTLPKAGEYLSLHMRTGKYLVEVDRVHKSCVCCSGAMTFVHATNVSGVAPQDKACQCASSRTWRDSAAWSNPPDHGLCKKVGANSLLDISEAIKRNPRNGKNS